MRFGYTILYVSDVRATIDFYERAFGVNRRMVKDGDYGELDTGATVLAFAANEFARRITAVAFDAADLSKPAPPIEIGFVTEDVEANYRRALAAGAIDVKKPEQKPWGQTVGYLRDLNGFLIEICSPL
jgi:lactoylglutathione lyase